MKEFEPINTSIQALDSSRIISETDESNAVTQEQAALLSHWVGTLPNTGQKSTARKPPGIPVPSPALSSHSQSIASS